MTTPHKSAQPDEIGGSVVFEHLWVQAFRGFAQPTEIDLNASVVIVHGPNGLGKTSLFDALQWVLVGDLSRLRSARMRQTDEYIVNVYSPGERARVEVAVRLANERVRLTRTGDRSGSTLTWTSPHHGTVQGQAAEELLASTFGREGLDLQTSLRACGLLQQDAVRDVLSAKPSERFETFSELLGLGELSSFQRWARSEADRTNAEFKRVDASVGDAHRLVTDSEAELTQLQTRRPEQPVITESQRRLSAALEAAGIETGEADLSRDVAAMITGVATNLASSYISASQQFRNLLLQTAPPEPVAAEQIAAARAAREAAEAALVRRAAEAGAAQKALNELRLRQASLTQMASAVIAHIEGPSCPACGQPVDEVELLSRLEGVEGTVATTDAERRYAETTSAREVAREEVARTQQVELEVERLSSVREEWATNLRRARQNLDNLMSSVPAGWRIPDLPDNPEAYADALESMAQGATQAASMARELAAAWDASSTNEEATLVDRLGSARQRLQGALERREAIGRAKNDAANIHEAIRNGRLELVRDEFARLGPLAQDIYSRLDPHPTFQDIDLVSDVFRAVGTTTAQVHDHVADISADPMLVFSSAQGNIAAISYLIALNLAAAVGAPTLLLDDPLQAMDDVNVLGFSDLCRHVRKERQLIISTHERRFAQLLTRKLAPRHHADRTISVEFVGWDRSGPIVKSQDVPNQSESLRPTLVL